MFRASQPPDREHTMSSATSLSRRKLYAFFKKTAKTIINREIKKENKEARLEANKKNAVMIPHYYMPARNNRQANDAYTRAVTKMADTMQAVAIAASEGKPHDAYLSNSKDPSLTRRGVSFEGESLARLRDHMAGMKVINSSALFETRQKSQSKSVLVPAQAA